jgi:pullulanase/glycogen debranching enzyme
VEKLRNRQVKNFSPAHLSIGMPDSHGRQGPGTQGGNCCAYCLDNELNWFDWSWSPARRCPSIRHVVTKDESYRRGTSVNISRPLIGE